MFQTLLVNPLFNLLLLIYALLPGNDFGIAIIILTIIIRILLWPLLKKQLHSQKAMRQLQPEIAKIKAKAKGDKQKEGQMMLELYKERGIKPFGALGTTLIQLPILFALFYALQAIVKDGEIAARSYDFIQQFGVIKEVVDGSHEFLPHFLGFVDLSRTATGSAGFYLPAFVLSALTGFSQFLQSRQLLPKAEDRRRLRDVLRDAKEGKPAQSGDQAAMMSSSMGTFLPIFTFVISLQFPAALSLYWASSSFLATIQQKLILNQDVEEMEESVVVKTEDSSSPAKKSKSKKPASKAKSGPKRKGGK